MAEVEVEEALREARRKEMDASWRRLARRVEVLPVPPVRRIAIVEGRLMIGIFEIFEIGIRDR
jgi:hypothetical protein